MTDDELQHIAERHFDGLPPQAGEEEVYAALDLAVGQLQMLRASAPRACSGPSSGTGSTA